MTAPIVTIVVVPRDRFSEAAASLASVYALTTFPFRLVYVDAGGPHSLKVHLDRVARQHQFEIVRTDGYLSPNRARNLGFSHVETPYVVFIDNDIQVAPGWLDALVECAEETGASVVGPLCCMGRPEHEVIHVAGGTLRFETTGGRRRLRESSRFVAKRVADVRTDLRREPTELLDFHGLLVRSETLRLIGGLDEAFLSSCDHLDLCLSVRSAGGTIYLEPRSVITFLNPPPVAAADLPFFLLRWSDAWNRATVERFRTKWRLTDDDEFLAEHYAWLTRYRQMGLPRVRHHLRRVLGQARGARVERALEESVTRWLLARYQEPDRSGFPATAPRCRSSPRRPSRRAP